MRDNNIYLKNIQYQLGEFHGIDSLAELQQNPLALETLSSLGLSCFSKCEGNIVDYAAQSIKKVLNSSGIEPRAIGAMVYATNTIDHTEPHQDALKCAMHELGLHHSYPYGISFSGCGNLQAGFVIATSLMAQGYYSNILLVAVDTANQSYTSENSRVYSNNVSVFSDGAAACLLTTSIDDNSGSVFRWVCTELVTDSRIVDYGRENNWAEIMRCTEFGIVDASQKALRKAGLSCNDIRVLITNNYNLSVTRLFSMAIGMSDSKVFIGNLGRYGHVYSADGLINLATFAETVRLRPGDNIMMLGSGPNTWGITILKYGA
ncbi:MAG: 3-oxoacyl-[acyl-carrier-protein] synthase III C-terminal domain-containing protein [Candidatus Sedimenticola sp. (ex Thyasira tokunagai)]